MEVKSGAAGSMKSLHQFMHDKRLPLALRPIRFTYDETGTRQEEAAGRMPAPQVARASCPEPRLKPPRVLSKPYWALRLDRNPPSVQAMEVSTTQGQAVQYTLLNLPHYLCAFLGEILPGLSGWHD